MTTAALRNHPTFDFASLLGTYRGATMLNVPQVCRILRRSPDFVEALIEARRLHGHTSGAPVKDRKTVTTASVGLYLAETALYEGGDYEARVRDLFGTWSREQREWAIRFLQAQS